MAARGPTSFSLRFGAREPPPRPKPLSKSAVGAASSTSAYSVSSASPESDQRDCRGSQADVEFQGKFLDECEVGLNSHSGSPDRRTQRVLRQHGRTRDGFAPTLNGVSTGAVPHFLKTRGRCSRGEMREFMQQREYSRLRVLARIHGDQRREVIGSENPRRPSPPSCNCMTTPPRRSNAWRHALNASRADDQSRCSCSVTPSHVLSRAPATSAGDVMVTRGISTASPCSSCSSRLRRRCMRRARRTGSNSAALNRLVVLPTALRSRGGTPPVFGGSGRKKIDFGRRSVFATLVNCPCVGPSSPTIQASTIVASTFRLAARSSGE